MKRTSHPLVWLAACALLSAGLVSGCATETQPSKTIEEATSGPAAGKTLCIAGLNMTSHPETPTVTTTQTEVGTVRQERDDVYVFDQIASDPRLTGEVTVVMNIDQRADDSGENWGTWVIKNKDGTWEGDFSEVVSGKNATVPPTAYLLLQAKGTGAYKGLELHMQGTSVENAEGFEPGTDNVLTGWIQKAQ